MAVVLARVLGAAFLVGVSSCAHRPDTQFNGPLVGGVELAGTLVRATVVSTLRNPVTSTQLGISMAFNRAEELIRGNLPFTLDVPPRVRGAPGTAEFSDGLTAIGLPAPALGTVELLIDGREFFPAFEEELRKATQSVDIQIYIWDNDDLSVEYANLVRARAREVPVRVLMDDLGSTISAMMKPETPPPPGFRAEPDIVRYLRRGRSPLAVRRILNPWAVLDHC
jgi:hypothetical protein